MINEELLHYIESEITKGTSKSTIQSNLLSNGWNTKDVAEAFSAIVVKNYNPALSTSPIGNNINTQKSIIPSQSSQSNIVSPTNPAISVNSNINPQSSITPIQNSQLSATPIISTVSISRNTNILKPIMPAQSYKKNITLTKKSGSLFLRIITLLIVCALGFGAYIYYKTLTSQVSKNSNIETSSAEQNLIVNTGIE